MSLCARRHGIRADPCEHHDLAAEHPEVVATLIKRLAVYEATVHEGLCDRGTTPAARQYPRVCGCWPMKQNSSNGTLTWRPCDLPV